MEQRKRLRGRRVFHTENSTCKGPGVAKKLVSSRKLKEACKAKVYGVRRGVGDEVREVGRA